MTTSEFQGFSGVTGGRMSLHMSLVTGCRKAGRRPLLSCAAADLCLLQLQTRDLKLADLGLLPGRCWKNMIHPGPSVAAGFVAWGVLELLALQPAERSGVWTVCTGFSFCILESSAAVIWDFLSVGTGFDLSFPMQGAASGGVSGVPAVCSER